MSTNTTEKTPAKLPDGPWTMAGQSKNGSYYKVRGTRLGQKWKIADVPFVPGEEAEAEVIANFIANSRLVEQPRAGAGELPDPGEGYRLLRKGASPEPPQIGDEMFVASRWTESHNGYANVPLQCEAWYRRKLQPATPPAVGLSEADTINAANRDLLALLVKALVTAGAPQDDTGDPAKLLAWAEEVKTKTVAPVVHRTAERPPTAEDGDAAGHVQGWMTGCVDMPDHWSDCRVEFVARNCAFWQTQPPAPVQPEPSAEEKEFNDWFEREYPGKNPEARAELFFAFSAGKTSATKEALK